MGSSDCHWDPRCRSILPV